MSTVEQRYQEWKKNKTTYAVPTDTEQRYQQWKSQKAVSTIADSLNSYIEENNAVINMVGSRYNEATLDKYRADYENYYKDVSNYYINAQNQYLSLKKQIQSNAQYLGQDYVDNAMKILDEYNKASKSIYDVAKGDYDFFSKFGNEAAYTNWKSQKEIEGLSSQQLADLWEASTLNDPAEYLQGAGLEQYADYLKSNKKVAYTTMDGKNVTWESLYNTKKAEEDATKLWNYISSQTDFKEFSEKGAAIENPSYSDAQGWISFGNWRPFGDEIGNIVTFSRDNIGKIGEDTIVNNPHPGNVKYAEMTDNEVSIYNYYLGKYGKDKANEFLDSIDDVLNEREYQSHLQGWEDATSKFPIISSLLSVLMSSVAARDGLVNLGTGLVTGEAKKSLAADINSTIRGTVANQIDSNIGKFLYTTGMSMADSIVAGYVPGGFAVLGLSAASNELNDAIDRGMDDYQAIFSGIAAGSFEALFEKVSIGEFKSMKAGFSSSGKQVFKNIAKSVVTNASEELATELANVFYDTFVNADFSQMETSIRQYMSQGMSKEDAQRKVYGETIGQVIESGISGGLMGFGFGGLASVSQYGNYNQAAKEIYGNNISDLVNEALESDPNNKLAKKIKGKLDAGKNVNARNIGRLASQTQSALLSGDIGAISKAVESRLNALGERGDNPRLANVIARQLVQNKRANIESQIEKGKASSQDALMAAGINESGTSLSKSEKALLKNSTYGQRVMNELENSTSGEYSSEWTGSIGTSQINYEEYNRMLQNMQAEQVAESQNIDEQAAQETTAPESIPTQEKAVQSDIEASQNVPYNVLGNVDNNAKLQNASKKYGAQAKAMVANYKQGQDVEKYDNAYRIAYDMGKSGVSLSYAMNSESTQYLSESQRETAYRTGEDAAKQIADKREEKNKAQINGKQGRKKGVVRSRGGVTVADLKKTFNDKQNIAYKILSTYAEATGIDIVLYNSEADENGEFQGAQGKFRWKDDTIYIDINAGISSIKDVSDLSKYTILRTFAHEFTHFIEKWNPVWYNEFRKLVFDTLKSQGENVDELVRLKMAESENLTYDGASREVVAEAMTDILPDTNFVQELAEKHKNIFQKLLERLKEFLQDIKDYFNSLVENPSREANALKEQIGDTVRYMDSIVKMFDEIAVQAVENYQAAVATDEVAQEEEFDDEYNALMAYKSGYSYILNAKLREYAKLNDYEEHIVKNLDSMLEKLPLYQGTVYRNIQFDGFGDAEEREKYVASHVVGDDFSYDQYLSSSTSIDGYPLEGDYVVKHIIQSANGKDLQGYGNNYESEVLFARNSYFITDKIEYEQDGTPIIYLTEVQNGEVQATDRGRIQGRNQRDPKGQQGASSKTEELSMQSMPKSHSRTITLQSISQGETDGYSNESAGVQVLQAEVTEGDAFTITDNAEYGSLEIKFDGKPSEAIRNALKEKGFRWHKTKGVWYGKADRADIVSALRDVYESETTAQEETATQETVSKTEQVAETDIQTVEETVGKKETHLERLEKERNKPYEELKSKYPDSLIFIRQEDGYRALDFNSIIKPEKLNNVIPTLTKAKRTVVVDGEKISVYPKGQTTPTTETIENTTQNEEEKTNGKNADNNGAVPQPAGDRQGDSRLLAKVEAGDVQGDAPRRVSLGRTEQNGVEIPRDDNRLDESRTDGLRSEGSSESGDLRRVSDVTPEQAEEKAQELRKEVEKEIEQKSTETPKGKNFVIGDSLNLPTGDKARYKANVEAIRLVKQLEAENRYATPAEQEVLSKYVGWGGLSDAFASWKKDWQNEYKELKELLTDEEYRAASASTNTAFYTDIPVIKAMYDGLRQLGFKGGYVLEPSAGIGNFIGAMPTDIASSVNGTLMVELDHITGLIAKYLYPNADVHIEGFQDTAIPNNYMDVAIGNVPFGEFPIYDKAYPRRITSRIHNYFFAKALDKVRPGGIVMFITSSGTMNNKDETVRKYIMSKADLLGAIRLPDNVFSQNAGTDVVSDILILKKRYDGLNYGGENFIGANEYFEAHPEMVLGTPYMKNTQHGWALSYKAYEDKGSIADQIRNAFANITEKMEYPAKYTREKANFAVEKASKKAKENSFVVKDGKIYQTHNGELQEHNVTENEAKRIEGMLGIRDAAKSLFNYQLQGLKESEISNARKALNKAYDDFVKKYGYINAPANKRAIAQDPDAYFLFALEKWNSKDKVATKADVFVKNTVTPNRTITSVKDISEGLIVSVNQTGGVDTALIARLMGKDEQDVIRELIDSRKVFKNSNKELETAETYLSGNVRAKLREAETLVNFDEDYKNNIEALKAVIPKDVEYQDIYVNPGTPWIPLNVYADFIAETLGGSNQYRKAVEVKRNPATGSFIIESHDKYLKTRTQNTQKWGTPSRSFLELFDAILNSRSVVVKNKLEDGSFEVDKDATAAANEKIEQITKEFQTWLWSDENRRVELARLYNETFNAIVTPKYNGDNLTVNGANATKQLRPHQRNAVQRVIASGGNTLLAHRVGAGKTYEMAASAMKLRELGLVKKPMFAVPKSLVSQWGTEFMDFFPTAKILVSDETDFTPANRKTFANRIANGDYDAVIVSYEQFEKLPMSKEFERQLYQEQIDDVIAEIQYEKSLNNKSASVKQLEKTRANLEAKIQKLSDIAKDEDNILFEELGVDSLFVDEAHNFKNLFYTTSMTNVAGLGNKEGSKRAFDLYAKVRYLQKLNGGKGIVFATATPVMNSMSEMYIMQRYLQPDVLNQLDLKTFDSWAKQFGEIVNGIEIKPSGQGYRIKQSFSKFKNLSELQLLFRNFADVLTDIPGLKIPKMKGGKVNVVVCEPGQFQKDYMKQLEKRADNIKNVDPSVDNMLKITSDGRKISYTQRMIDPSLPYEEGCKIYRCADNVIKTYKDSKAIKGTQLVFLDMATPKATNKANPESTDNEMNMQSAQLYEDIKARMIKGGIPANEIAFIHEANTDAKKKQLFEDVNEGKIRVLIGSTAKMGVGMNAQKRVVAIHHLDAPWRPGDVEQRNGRAFRQGNMNDEVECFTYVTEGSFDARLWDILERKQNFIDQIMNGENVGREVEDTGEVTLSAAEIKALASGSPLILEQVQLDTDIKKLESLLRAHSNARRLAQSKLSKDIENIALLENRIANAKEDIQNRKDTYSDGKFSMTIGNTKYTEKKEAGTALMAQALSKATAEGYTTIAKFANFELRVVKTYEGIKGLLAGKQGYQFNTYPNNTTYMINHISDIVKGLDNQVKVMEAELAETKNDVIEQEKLIAQPFEKQAELDQKRKRYNEVMDILKPKEEQTLDEIDEDVVQEQQRIKAYSDREVLEIAADRVVDIDLNDAEKDALQIFKNRLSKLYDLQEQRTEQGKLYKDQQFGTTPDRAGAEKTLNRMKILDDQIKRASDSLLTVEEKEVLKRVLKSARKVVEENQRERDKQILKNWQERRNEAAAVKKYRERIRINVNALTDWIMHPNNKDVVKHVPDALKDAVIPFLASIDFTSKRALRGGAITEADKKYQSSIKNLYKALDGIKRNEIETFSYLDVPPQFIEKLQTMAESVEDLVDNNSGEYVINKMTSAELKDLADTVITLKKLIQDFDKYHEGLVFLNAVQGGENSIHFMEKMEDANIKFGNINNQIMWKQVRSASVFERFGNGGEAIYDEFRRAQSKEAFNTVIVKNFVEETYTAEEADAWKDTVHEIEIDEKTTAKMTVPQIMSLYLLYDQEDSKKDLLGKNAGIRVATFKHKGKNISNKGLELTAETINKIIDTLTERQKEVAKALQKFMAEQGGEWGNEVSQKRWGENIFTRKDYFPITVDGRQLQAENEETPANASLYALLNMSFTKSRNEKAVKRLVIYDVFDVFANHMQGMIRYNALALPVLDALKWFNYRQIDFDNEGNRIVGKSVREEMARVYGAPTDKKVGKGAKSYAEDWFINLIKSFNGTSGVGTAEDGAFTTGLRVFNKAQVAFNFRVVAQQPLSISRAAEIIDYSSILKGLKLSPNVIQRNTKEMLEHSGIAVWKSLGFYDVNISRGLTDIINRKSTVMDKIGDVGMWGAEKADELAWSTLWAACKEEVIRKYNLIPSDEGFYDAVTKLFEDVIYKTQVVDSILTKSEFMRSQNTAARVLSSFMSEPVTSASMVISTYAKYRMDRQRGLSRSEALKKNKKAIIRTTTVYTINALLVSAVTAAIDAIRDDDEYEEGTEKWWDAFKSNLIDNLQLLNKLPGMSDVYELTKRLLEKVGVDTYGYEPQTLIMQWADSLLKGVEIIHDKITEEDTNYTWYGGIFNLLKAISGASGLPVANVTKTVVTAWNEMVDDFAPDLVIRTYEPKELSKIKYAYKDGFLTKEEAYTALLDEGLADDEDEAYWIVRGWDSNEGNFSRFRDVYDAVLGNGDFEEAQQELLEHGYTEKEVISQIKSQVGKWYRDGNISKSLAQSILKEYCGLSYLDISKTIKSWDDKK